MEGIVQASNEQSLGMTEIGKAMNQLQSVTDDNVKKSSDSQGTVTSLAENAHHLLRAIAELEALVSGSKRS